MSLLVSFTKPSAKAPEPRKDEFARQFDEEIRKFSGTTSREDFGKSVQVNADQINKVSTLGEATWIRMKDGENIYVAEAPETVQERIDEAEIARAVAIRRAERTAAPA